MRPTPYEVLCNSSLFIELLEAQGVENARPRVIAIVKQMIEYRSVDNWLKRLSADLQELHQQPSRYPERFSKARNPERAAKNWHKRIAPLRTNCLRYRIYLKRTKAAIEAKIASWPELSYQDVKLRQKPDPALIKHHLERRSSRGRRLKLSG